MTLTQFCEALLQSTSRAQTITEAILIIATLTEAAS